MGRIRTFLAIDPGKTIRDRLVSLQENLARLGAEVKWDEPENLHITLLFLGEVDERDVLEVCKAVTTVTQKHPAFEISVEGAGCFPNPRRPRVLWVGVGKGLQDVVAVHDALETPLLELGCYRREERQYTPHITLGRIKSERATDKLAAALLKHQSFSAGETAVGEILVMSSQLASQGPTY